MYVYAVSVFPEAQEHRLNNVLADVFFGNNRIGENNQVGIVSLENFSKRLVPVAADGGKQALSGIVAVFGHGG